jgi:type VI secretion system secreted protein Hcp
MPIDTHIKFDGIDGEATDRDHKGEIEVLSWSWGLSAQPSGGPGAGGASGKATAQDLSFVHHYDKASPLLARAAATGTHLKQVTLAARRSGQGQKDFLKVTMKEVFVTAVQPSGTQAEGIAESVSVRSRQIAFEYQPTDTKGQPGTPVKFSWDIAANKVT